MLEIAFRPDRSSDVPLPRQLADHLADLIESGRLVPGRKLPATREAAGALGFGRKTVAAAYEILTARGLVEAHVGQGTFVASHGRIVRRSAAEPAAPRRLAPRAFAWAGLFARAAARSPGGLLRHLEADGSYPFDFRGGRIDVTALPIQELRWAFARPFAQRARLETVARHQDPFGWPPLRRELARALGARGIACDTEDVAVLSGVQQAIALTARVLVEPGDAVAIEQPGYFGAALAFAGAGAELIGIDVDREGLDPGRLARLLRVRRVKLIYTTPATQSPTGATLSPARREELLALADEYQVPVLEDDYDAELRYAGPALPALKATDAAGQVIHAGTFSKILFPSLRLGYVVAARPLLERLVTARAVADLGSGAVEQAALASLLATGGLERHLRRIRKRYAERLAALLAALPRGMPEGTSWTEPRSGHLVWLRLPPGVDPDRVQQAARGRGVAYTRGEVFFCDGRGSDHLALSFAALDPTEIAEGVARLGSVLREHTTRQRDVGGRRRAPAKVKAARRRPGRRSAHATS